MTKMTKQNDEPDKNPQYARPEIGLLGGRRAG